jgi:hypothetical protein
MARPPSRRWRRPCRSLLRSADRGAAGSLREMSGSWGSPAARWAPKRRAQERSWEAQNATALRGRAVTSPDRLGRAERLDDARSDQPATRDPCRPCRWVGRPARLRARRGSPFRRCGDRRAAHVNEVTHAARLFPDGLRSSRPPGIHRPQASQLPFRRRRRQAPRATRPDAGHATRPGVTCPNPPAAPGSRVAPRPPADQRAPADRRAQADRHPRAARPHLANPPLREDPRW